MVDQDGVNTYSEIITIKNNTTGEARIFPTLIQPNTSLWLQTGKQLENVSITITDIMGRAVMQQHMPVLPGNQTTSFTLPGMVKGTYVVQVKDVTGVQLNQKIVVQ
nr:T9SS type A sorting domain-containing protein [Niastella soli]